MPFPPLSKLSTFQALKFFQTFAWKKGGGAHQGGPLCYTESMSDNMHCSNYFRLADHRQCWKESGGGCPPSIPHGINQLYKGCTIWHDDPEKCMVTSMKITYTEIEVMDWGPAEHHHWHPAIYTGQQLSSTKKQKSTTKNKNKNKKRRRKQKQQQQKTKKPVTQMLQSKEWGNRIPWCKVRWNLRTQDKRSITVPSSGHQICTSLLQQ